MTIRLTPEERQLLEEKAGTKALSAYVREIVLERATGQRSATVRVPPKNQSALAQILALLGRSGLPPSLHELARNARMGTVDLSDEALEQISKACTDIADVKASVDARARDICEMILKGVQRSGAKALAIHLLRTDENDHVEVHSIEGFCTHDLTGGLKEVQASAKGTRCRQPLFSVSLSPPVSATVTIEMFEAAISKIAETTGLNGQPRVVVFHEKDGRRHCHVIFSRIDAETMTAKNLPHFKLKLRQISRSLYFEHGWKMPPGLMNSAARNPSNVTLAEWQSAKRREKNAIDEKLVIQECWAASDNGDAFKQLLFERGYLLAQRNRKNHVVISHDGRVSAVARATGLRVKDVLARLRYAADLPDLSVARDQLASGLLSTFGRMAQEVRTVLLKKRKELNVLKMEMVEKHRNERVRLDKAQVARWESEAKERASRLQRGLSGLWQRITGRTKTKKLKVRLKRMQRLCATGGSVGRW